MPASPKLNPRTAALEVVCPRASTNNDMSQIFYLNLKRIETGQLQGQHARHLDLPRTPDQPKICEIAQMQMKKDGMKRLR